MWSFYKVYKYISIFLETNLHAEGLESQYHPLMSTAIKINIPIVFSGMPQGIQTPIKR